VTSAPLMSTLGAGLGLGAPASGGRRRARRTLRAGNFLTLLGFMSMYVGLRADAPAVVIAGAALVCSGGGVVVRGIVLARGARQRDPP